MSGWDKVGLNEFKRKVRAGKMYIDNDPDSDTYNSRSKIAEVGELLNNVLLWLAELEETKEEEK